MFSMLRSRAELVCLIPADSKSLGSKPFPTSSLTGPIATVIKIWPTSEWDTFVKPSISTKVIFPDSSSRTMFFNSPLKMNVRQWCAKNCDCVHEAYKLQVPPGGCDSSEILRGPVASCMSDPLCILGVFTNLNHIAWCWPHAVLISNNWAESPQLHLCTWHTWKGFTSHPQRSRRIISFYQGEWGKSAFE